MDNCTAQIEPPDISQLTGVLSGANVSSSVASRETLRRSAHPRRQIKDGNGAVIRLGAPAPMVKRPLTRIAYALGLPALPYPNGERARRNFGPTLLPLARLGHIGATAQRCSPLG